MERIEINVVTGERVTIPLTAEEILEIQSRPTPEPPAPLTTAEKLARVGLTVAELKALLAAPE
jgi:hypothetical protein